jgi:glyoxylase-like metal-dependent hydrolase (beta-lactamase superfamily II)
MKRGIALGAVIAVGTTLMVAAAYRVPQASLSPEAVEAARIEKVRDRLYVITGSNRSPSEAFSGGNTAVFITTSGVVLVDTKLPGWGHVILDRVRTVTDKPVTTIINTHTHGDHTGSNAFFSTDVDIVAHEQTRSNMEKMDLFKQSNGRGLPTKTFKDRMSIGAGEDRIDLYYFGRGHTNGDTWVVFPALHVMHAGDMFARKDAPTLDGANGGSGLEFAQTIGKAVATVTDVDTLIVGHGPLRTVPELREYQRFMIDFVAAVRRAMKAGESVDDAAASIDLSATYKDYQRERYRAAVEAIYDELKK